MAYNYYKFIEFRLTFKSTKYRLDISEESYFVYFSFKLNVQIEFGGLSVLI